MEVQIRCKHTGTVLTTIRAPERDPVDWPQWWIWELVTLKEKYDGEIHVPEE